MRTLKSHASIWTRLSSPLLPSNAALYLSVGWSSYLFFRKSDPNQEGFVEVEIAEMPSFDKLPYPKFLCAKNPPCAQSCCRTFMEVAVIG